MRGCRQNTLSHAHFSQTCRVEHVWAQFTFTRTWVWLKMFTRVVLSLCALKEPSISQHVWQNTSRRTWHLLIVSFLASTTPTVRPLTGIRSCPCATSPEGMQSGHLAKLHPHTGYEPRSFIDVSNEHTPIRGETASTSRRTSPPQAQPLRTSRVFISKRQPAVACSLNQEMR